MGYNCLYKALYAAASVPILLAISCTPGDFYKDYKDESQHPPAPSAQKGLTPKDIERMRDQLLFMDLPDADKTKLRQNLNSLEAMVEK